jgi:alpha-mannosidase
VSGSDIGLTVVRSPVYAHHIPHELQPDRTYPYMDQGVQYFQYTLLPHPGGWQQAGTVRRAAGLNQPPVAVFATYHPQGTLPQSDAFIVVEPEHVLVTVLKWAETGDDLVLRAYETSGAASRAVIRLPKWGRTIETDFMPGEIKTFRIPRDPSQPVYQTDLLE